MRKYVLIILDRHSGHAVHHLSPPLEVPPSPNAGIPPIAAFRVWEIILKSLDPSPEFSLLFAIVDDDSLVMMSDGA